MIKRILILLEILSKMSDSLYILRCSGRSYPVRYTVILVTSRDCSHITWSRNPASVSLLATVKCSRLSCSLKIVSRLSRRRWDRDWRFERFVRKYRRLMWWRSYSSRVFTIQRRTRCWRVFLLWCFDSWQWTFQICTSSSINHSIDRSWSD
jgi:hypothetical protein